MSHVSYIFFKSKKEVKMQRIIRTIGLFSSVFFLLIFLNYNVAFPKILISKYQKSNTTFEIDYRQFDINQIRDWFGNSGEIVSYHPTGDAGLEWPKGSNLTVVFQSGLWIAGMVDNDLRTAVVEYESEMSPGIIIYTPGSQTPGLPADPDSSRYRIYIINKGDSPDSTDFSFNRDYIKWPVNDGAPAHDGEYFTDSNNNGVYDPEEEFEDYNLNGNYDGPDGIIEEGQDPPLHLGDQTCWFVCNDATLSNHNVFSTEPLNIEVQVTIWGYDTDEMENVMFIKWLIINKSGNAINDTYVSIWADPDIGTILGDYVGCDTTLSLGYCYNIFPFDDFYGYFPPSVGFDFFQGPIVPSPGEVVFLPDDTLENYRMLKMTSFVKFTNSNPDYRDPGTALQAYNYLKGLKCDGEPWTYPDGSETVFLYPGDPTNGTGYIESDDDTPGDRRLMMSSGPFDFPSWEDENNNGRAEPGESGVQEIVGAIIIGQGDNNLSSITKMKDVDRIAQSIYLYGENRPHLTITSPERDTVYTDSVLVQWINEPGYPPATNIEIQFSSDYGTSYKTIAKLPFNSGSYKFSINDVTQSAACKVKVIGSILSDQIGMDISERFGIDDPNVNTPPNLWGLSQSQGTDISVSGDYEINWSMSDPDGDDILIYIEAKNLYEDWHSISEQLTNTDYFLWQTERFINSSEYRLRIRASDGVNEVVKELPHIFQVYNERTETLPVDNISGISNALATVALIDENQFKNHEYIISFSRSSNATYFSVYDRTSGIYKLENLPILTEYDESPLFDGLAISFSNFEGKSDLIPELSSWIVGDCNWEFSVLPGNVFGSPFIQTPDVEIMYTEDGSYDIYGNWAPIIFKDLCHNIDLDFYILNLTEDEHRFFVLDTLYTLIVLFEIDIKSSDSLVSVPPDPGDALLLIFSRPFSDEDTLSITNPYSINNYNSYPKKIKLFQNYPNPFNSITTIQYELPRDSFVTLEVFNLRGQLVSKLVNQFQKAGCYSVKWGGINVSSGIYFYRLKVGNSVKLRRLVLIK